MWIYIHVYINGYVYIYKYIMYISINLNVYICMYLYLYMYIYIYIRMYVYVYMCMYIRVHIHLYLSTHIHLCIYTSTHTHAHTYIWYKLALLWTPLYFFFLGFLSPSKHRCQQPAGLIMRQVSLFKSQRVLNLLHTMTENHDVLRTHLDHSADKRSQKSTRTKFTTQND